MPLAARMVAMKSSCFLRQLDGFFGGTAYQGDGGGGGGGGGRREAGDRGGCSLTFGLTGLRVEMSVPSARCLLESKVFLFLAAIFWHTSMCFFCKGGGGTQHKIRWRRIEGGKGEQEQTFGKKLLPQILQAVSAMMTDAESMYESFIASRRSGRRNAVPLMDVPIVLPADPAASQAGDSTASTSAADLSHDLAQLCVNKSGAFSFEEHKELVLLQYQQEREQCS
ncbi:hypothetical protein CRUP_024556 [Coryphaenoides rupestris]|nr:hypothetical protein CRUP_024556 [Coryphaenoides rupestris]